MHRFLRFAAAVVGLMALSGGPSPAASPKEIEAAIQKGSAALKAKFTGGGGTREVGPTCLAGLALLESGVKVDDPAVRAITDIVRNAAYKQSKTYQVSLCLMYLDRHGDPADVPLIQALAVRLLVGQSATGGWGYDACGQVAQADEQRLRSLKPFQVAKLHPEVEKYGQVLTAAKIQGTAGGPVGAADDNSNTQFAVIAVWLARKHGVPVEATLDLTEKRFLSTQSARTGGWSYMGPLAGNNGIDSPGTPSMYCAGLIGMATAVARREDRRAKAVPVKKDDPTAKLDPKSDPKSGPADPFFTPPSKGADPKKPEPKRPLDARDLAIQFAFKGLGVYVAESAQASRGALTLRGGGQHGIDDLYFFWSMERVGVIYGVEKIGGVDWYEAGAQTLIANQKADGSWGGGYGVEVDTSFAVLFLCRSNLARDLSSKVQKETATEMRAGAGPTDTKPMDPGANVAPKVNPNVPDPIVAGPTGSEAGTLAAELLRAADKDWSAALGKLRDGKGGTYTIALTSAVTRLDGDKKKSAREALAERLTRMTAGTLRELLKSDDAELRRAASLACAMKDDKDHVADLAAMLNDDEDRVIRAAKAGLRSLTGQDFGPGPNASPSQKRLAVDAWRDWLSTQKK